MTNNRHLKGIVTAFEWGNPHALIFVDVVNETGKVEKWTAETNSPNTLSRQGWNRIPLRPGPDHLIGHRVKGGAFYI